MGASGVEAEVAEAHTPAGPGAPPGVGTPATGQAAWAERAGVAKVVEGAAAAVTAWASKVAAARRALAAAAVGAPGCPPAAVAASTAA
eukprot:6903710-Prymnesium_polylepis.1